MWWLLWFISWNEEIDLSSHILVPFIKKKTRIIVNHIVPTNFFYSTAPHFNTFIACVLFVCKWHHNADYHTRMKHIFCLGFHILIVSCKRFPVLFLAVHKKYLNYIIWSFFTWQISTHTQKYPHRLHKK